MATKEQDAMDLEPRGQEREDHNQKEDTSVASVAKTTTTSSSSNSNSNSNNKKRPKSSGPPRKHPKTSGPDKIAPIIARRNLIEVDMHYSARNIESGKQFVYALKAMLRARAFPAVYLLIDMFSEMQDMVCRGGLAMPSNHLLSRSFRLDRKRYHNQPSYLQEETTGRDALSEDDQRDDKWGKIQKEIKDSQIACAKVFVNKFLKDDLMFLFQDKEDKGDDGGGDDDDEDDASFALSSDEEEAANDALFTVLFQKIPGLGVAIADRLSQIVERATLDDPASKYFKRVRDLVEKWFETTRDERPFHTNSVEAVRSLLVASGNKHRDFLYFVMHNAWMAVGQGSALMVQRHSTYIQGDAMLFAGAVIWREALTLLSYDEEAQKETRRALTALFQDYYVPSAARGFSVSAEIFPLRCLWYCCQYHHTVEGNHEFKDALQVLLDLALPALENEWRFYLSPERTTGQMTRYLDAVSNSCMFFVGTRITRIVKGKGKRVPAKTQAMLERMNVLRRWFLDNLFRVVQEEEQQRRRQQSDCSRTTYPLLATLIDVCMIPLRQPRLGRFYLENTDFSMTGAKTLPLIKTKNKTLPPTKAKTVEFPFVFRYSDPIAIVRLLCQDAAILRKVCLKWNRAGEDRWTGFVKENFQDHPIHQRMKETPQDITVEERVDFFLAISSPSIKSAVDE